jgi:hypothetical protein
MFRIPSFDPVSIAVMGFGIALAAALPFFFLIDGRPPAIVDGVVLEDCGFVSGRGESSRSGCVGKMLLTREDLELLKRLQAAVERGRNSQI